jgi:hypothetical protein
VNDGYHGLCRTEFNGQRAFQSRHLKFNLQPSGSNSLRPMASLSRSREAASAVVAAKVSQLTWIERVWLRNLPAIPVNRDLSDATEVRRSLPATRVYSQVANSLPKFQDRPVACDCSTVNDVKKVSSGRGMVTCSARGDRSARKAHRSMPGRTQEVRAFKAGLMAPRPRWRPREKPGNRKAGPSIPADVPFADGGRP